MGMGRKKLKGAAALSIVALASVMGAASASADDTVCLKCVIEGPPLVTPGRENAFLKIQGANGNAVDAFYKYRTGNSFHKDGAFDKHRGTENAFHKIENNPGQAFLKISENDAFKKV